MNNTVNGRAKYSTQGLLSVPSLAMTDFLPPLCFWAVVTWSIQ